MAIHLFLGCQVLQVRKHKHTQNRYSKQCLSLEFDTQRLKNMMNYPCIILQPSSAWQHTDIGEQSSTINASSHHTCQSASRRGWMGLDVVSSCHKQVCLGWWWWCRQRAGRWSRNSGTLTSYQPPVLQSWQHQQQRCHYLTVPLPVQLDDYVRHLVSPG